MHRVVTKVMDTRNGVRKRIIDLGPWQPSESVAQRWATYLESTGRYDTVIIQSNGKSASASEPGMQQSDEDLFLEGSLG